MKSDPITDMLRHMLADAVQKFPDAGFILMSFQQPDPDAGFSCSVSSNMTPESVPVILKEYAAQNDGKDVQFEKKSSN